MQSTKGRRITWLPIARESEARQVQNKNGDLLNVNQDKKGYVGLTYMDGVTVIPPAAFERGPGFLASTLLHERTHFEQITTHGRGDVFSDAQAQQEAYQVQVDNSAYFFDPVKDKALSDGIQLLLSAEMVKVEAQKAAGNTIKGMFRQFFLPSGPPDVFESKIHTNAEMADIRKLVDQARAQAEIAQRDHEERQAATQSSEDRAGPVTGFWNGNLDKFQKDLAKLREPGPEPADISQSPTAPEPAAVHGISLSHFVTMLPGIRGFAADSCRTPGQVPLTEDITMPSKSIFFTPVIDDPEIERLSSGLGTCELNLFLKLVEVIRAGRGPWITNPWVAEAARYYSARSAPRVTNPERAPVSRSREPRDDDNNRVWDPGCNCWTRRY